MEDEDNLNPKKRGLGRGLNALFADDEEQRYTTPPTADMSEIIENALGESDNMKLPRRVIDVELLQPSNAQPRQIFNDDSLKQLARSISAHGVLQPLLVRPLDGPEERYEIVAGERRWRAAQLAQLHRVPAIIHAFDDVEALEVALIENLQREDLNPLDEAQGYERLMEEFGHTQEKLADSLAKSRSHVANMMRLLKLPAGVQALVRDEKLTAGHARALINAQDPEDLAKKVIAQGLSVRETERLAKEEGGVASRSKPEKKAAAKPKKDVDTLALEEELTNVLGMNVTINMKDSYAGNIKIEFASLDQLDEVLHRLTHNPGRLG